MGEDDLQVPLVQLDLAANPDVVAGLNVGDGVFADIPEQAADLSGLVPELGEQVEIGVAVGAKLFVAQQIDIVEGLSVGELVNELMAHGGAILSGFL